MEDPISFVRSRVSKQKRRFQVGGYNLDLSYITPRIIAMGYPSEGSEAVYRNPMIQVKSCLDKLHYEKYRVYNLCSERFYHPSKFDYRAVRFPFDDHNPPPFSLIEHFCDDVHNWLVADAENVVCVHCKAGKGRTGTLIACYLLYAALQPDADSALKFYAFQRTQNYKGVTIPSQRRYVKYFEKYISMKSMGIEVKQTLCRLKLINIINLENTNLESVYVIVKSDAGEYYTDPSKNAILVNSVILNTDNIIFCGDTRITFVVSETSEVKFALPLHSNFCIDGTSGTEIFSKEDLDGIHKSKSRRFGDSFKVMVSVETVEQTDDEYLEDIHTPSNNNKMNMLTFLAGVSSTLLQLKSNDASIMLQYDINLFEDIYNLFKKEELENIPNWSKITENWASVHHLVDLTLNTIKVANDNIQASTGNTMVIWGQVITELESIVETYRSRSINKVFDNNLTAKMIKKPSRRSRMQSNALEACLDDSFNDAFRNISYSLKRIQDDYNNTTTDSKLSIASLLDNVMQQLKEGYNSLDQ